MGRNCSFRDGHDTYISARSLDMSERQVSRDEELAQALNRAVLNRGLFLQNCTILRFELTAVATCLPEMEQFESL